MVVGIILLVIGLALKGLSLYLEATEVKPPDVGFVSEETKNLMGWQ